MRRARAAVGRGMGVAVLYCIAPRSRDVVVLRHQSASATNVSPRVGLKLGILEHTRLLVVPERARNRENSESQMTV